MKQPSACKGIGIKNPSSGFSIPTPYTPKPNRFTSHTLLGLFLKAGPLHIRDHLQESRTGILKDDVLCSGT